MMFDWQYVLFSLLILDLTISRRYGSSISVFIMPVNLFWEAVVCSCLTWWLQFSKYCSSSICWHHNGHSGM